MADLSMSGGKVSVHDFEVGEILDALRSRAVELPTGRHHTQEHLNLIDVEPEADYRLIP
jgi:hypothetical protein